MTDDREIKIEAILQMQQTISRAIRASASQPWMELGLSMAQLKTLIPLYESGASPIGQIAEAMGVGQPTASHLVDKLVQNGLVVRTEDPLDRRRNLAELSPEGIELIVGLREVRYEILHRLLVQLDDEALTAFYVGCRALAEVAEAERTSLSQSSE